MQNGQRAPLILNEDFGQNPRCDGAGEENVALIESNDDTTDDHDDDETAPNSCSAWP